MHMWRDLVWGPAAAVRRANEGRDLIAVFMWCGACFTAGSGVGVGWGGVGWATGHMEVCASSCLTVALQQLPSPPVSEWGSARLAPTRACWAQQAKGDTIAQAATQEH